MKLSKKREFVSREELIDVFNGTNFGESKPENIVKWGLLKIASGYSTGYTVMAILQELGLVSKTKILKLTDRGEFCLWEYFHHGYRHE